MQYIRIYFNQGRTTSIDTGPTSAGSGHYYKYIEISPSALVENSRAILETTKTFQGTLNMY